MNLSIYSDKHFKYAELLKRVSPFIIPHMRRILLGFLISIPAGASDGLLALSLKPYLDYVVMKRDFSFEINHVIYSITAGNMVVIIPGVIVVFAILQGVLRYLNGYLSKQVSIKITNAVKSALFAKMVCMDASFFDKNTSGILLTRYLSDPDRASAGIVNYIKALITNFAGALSLIAVMLFSSVKLALIGVIVLCTAFLPAALIRKRVRETSNKNIIIGGNIVTNFNETYSGNKIMRAYGLQEHRVNMFNNQLKEAYKNNMSFIKRAGWMSPLMYLIASFGVAVVLGYGTHLININEMSAGSFAAFVTSLLLLYKPVKSIGNTLTSVQNVFVSLERVSELFDLKPKIKNKKKPKKINGLQHSIEFRNVYFGYEVQTNVLKNINLITAKNETIAIVGNSGGGKSTLVNLLLRFYDTSSGEILIDGVNIKEISLESLRDNIAVVFQDNFLYSGTIRENIIAGNYSVKNDEIQKAAAAAHLDEMLEVLPDGLETVIGERGLTLSGGERQRIAIARAILKNAPIIILDEATSALDNHSEAVVQKALENLIKNKTVFVIAHRLSTIKNADKIVVLNNGKIEEVGTHQELTDLKEGYYRKLYESQFKEKVFN